MAYLMDCRTEKIDSIFKEGDIVQLKSNGPNMTVKRIHETAVGDRVVCDWFDKNHKLNTGNFAQNQIFKI